MNGKDAPDKAGAGFMKFPGKDLAAPVREFVSESGTGVFSRGTKEAAKGMAAFLTKDLTGGSRKTKIKNATAQTLISVVSDLVQKGDKLTHDELDVLLQIASDTQAEKQTLFLLQNTREPEKYKNKNLVATRVRTDDVIPVLNLVGSLDRQGQALVIANKVAPADVLSAIPYLSPLLDKGIRLALIRKCPVKDLPALFESFKALPITKDEVDLLIKSQLRAGSAMPIFSGIDAKNYSLELIHWAVHHADGSEIHAIYRKTRDYLDGVLQRSGQEDQHRMVVRIYQLMFMNIAPDLKALTKYVQSPAPCSSDLVSLNNIFALLERESMLICTCSNAGAMQSKFLRLSYDVCCLVGKKEVFDRAAEAALSVQDLRCGVPPAPDINSSAAAKLIEGYASAYRLVLTKQRRDECPELFSLAAILNEIARSFGGQ